MLENRDELDARTNPLTPPPGATVIDTGALDADATLRTAIAVDPRAGTGAPAVSLPKIAVVGRSERRQVDAGEPSVRSPSSDRAHGMPGVTRDRSSSNTTWRGRSFGLVDTAGYLHGARGSRRSPANRPSARSTRPTLILLVVDARTGITEEDAQLARRSAEGLRAPAR